MDEIINIHLSVTRDDLDNGLRGQAESCPIALAVGHALQKEGITSDRIEIDGDIKVFIDGERYDWIWKTHKEHSIVCDFIHNFDKEKYVAPFELDIELELHEEDFDEE